MNVPTWMPATDNSFDPSSTPITIYNHLKRWMKLNLSPDENLLMELGGNESWPQRGVTRDIEIQQALQYVIAELGQLQDLTREDYAFPSYIKSILTDTNKVKCEQHTLLQQSCC